MKKILILTFVIFISSCSFSQGPKNNQEFTNSLTIDMLVGKYLNRGEPAASQIYLSNLLWSNEIKFHYKIDTIHVTKINDQSLQVIAFDDSKIVKKDIFTEGINFNLQDDRITLSKNNNFISHNILSFGHESKTISLGIDEKGDGKYRNNSHFIGSGLVYFFYPVSLSNSSDVRFKKINE